MPDSVALRLETATPLFTGPNWDYSGLRRVYDAVERIALDELGLDVYPVQVEVITSEQMLDAYASVGFHFHDDRVSEVERIRRRQRRHGEEGYEDGVAHKHFTIIYVVSIFASRTSKMKLIE